VEALSVDLEGYQGRTSVQKGFKRQGRREEGGEKRPRKNYEKNKRGLKGHIQTMGSTGEFLQNQWKLLN
jgi:hypothetical protein